MARGVLECGAWRAPTQQELGAQKMKVTRRPLLGWCPSVEPVVVRLELTASETRRLRDVYPPSASCTGKLDD